MAGNGYIRQDSSNDISNGSPIDANDLDNEFDALADAFLPTEGHTHDGTTGSGGPILAIGPTRELVVGSLTVLPKTHNLLSLGTTGTRFKDLWVTEGLNAATTNITGIATASEYRTTVGGDPNIKIGYGFVGKPGTGLHHYTTADNVVLVYEGVNVLIADKTSDSSIKSVTVPSGVVFTASGNNLTDLNADSITEGTLNTARLSTSTPARDWVAARTAAIVAGAVGDFAFLRNNSSSANAYNSTNDGGTLSYSSSAGGGSVGPPAGTVWRCLGSSGVGAVTLYKRVS